MSRTVALVASSTAHESAEALAQRMRYLLEHRWDAWLYCKGARWRDDPALRDPDLRNRVALAPDAPVDSSPFDGSLRSLRPDLVHFHSTAAAWRGLRNGQLRSSMVVISFGADGGDLHEVDLDLLWARGDLMLFPNRVALERALERGCPEERAAILKPPVQVRGSEDRRVPEDGSLRVLSAGPLVWEQGFEHSIQAIAMLLDQGVRCEYRIIGDGPHDEAVAFARHQLGLHDHVHLISQDGDGQLPEELRSADVFVDPAVADATSSAPRLTAQAHAVPFVATAAEVPLPEDAGIEVPRRDPSAIAAALARLAGDPDMRERMGRRAAHATGAWPVEDHLAELERLYGATLAGEPR